MCGEKNPLLYVSAVLAGSPPRVRGEGSSRTTTSTLRGITPACAGRRRRQCPGAYPCRDHPRVCGEKY